MTLPADPTIPEIRDALAPLVAANAAFDVWLAMAPPVPEVTDSEQVEAVSAGRPGWLRAIEAIAVLLFVALVVAAGLYIIG